MVLVVVVLEVLGVGIVRVRIVLVPLVVVVLDDVDVTAKKIMRAVTDNEGSVRYDRENKPGVSNLLTIYAALTGRQVADCFPDEPAEPADPESAEGKDAAPSQ